MLLRLREQVGSYDYPKHQARSAQDANLQMMKETTALVQALIHKHRQAVLAVCENDVPYTAMASYAWHAGGVLIHLSNLSAHKRVLMANPQCSLLIAEPDDGRAEVMSLARLTLNGSAIKLDKAGEVYAAAQTAYLTKLPSSEIMFELPDFDLFHIVPASGRFIGGFGRIYNLDPDDLKQL